MNRCPIALLSATLLLLLFPGHFVAAGGALAKARAALKSGQTKKARSLIQKVLRNEPNSAAAWYTSAAIEYEDRQDKKAVAHCNKAIAIDPKLASAYQIRGLANFRLGKVKGSVRDFDKYIHLNPRAKRSHWQRGISLYYAGKFKEGKRQFEGYQEFDSNDVENAVWRYLCMRPLVGKKKSQTAMLKIGKDDRIPMRQIYDLFSGNVGAKKVMQAVHSGSPNKTELNKRLFYAHLYLGLYLVSEGKSKEALTHLNTATEKHRIGHYMWDVARVHRDILVRRSKKSVHPSFTQHSVKDPAQADTHFASFGSANDGSVSLVE